MSPSSRADEPDCQSSPQTTRYRKLGAYRIEENVKHLLFALAVLSLLVAADTKSRSLVAHRPKLQSHTTIPVGLKPNGIVINEETGLVYVANQESSTVSVINRENLTVIDAISVSTGPYWQLAVDTVAGRLYVPNNAAHALTIINSHTNTVIDVIEDINYQPEGIGFSTLENHVYITHGTSSFTVIERGTLEIVDVVNTGQHNHLIQVDEINNVAYVSKSDPGEVAVINLADLEVIDSVATIGNAWDFALNADSSLLFVTITAGAVDVIDLAQRKVIKTINVGSFPQGVSLSPITGCLYVANAGDDTVSIISSDTFSRMASVQVGDWPNDVAIDSITGQVFVSNKNDGTVSVFDELDCLNPTYSFLVPVVLDLVER